MHAKAARQATQNDLDQALEGDRKNAKAKAGHLSAHILR